MVKGFLSSAISAHGIARSVAVLAFVLGGVANAQAPAPEGAPSPQQKVLASIKWTPGPGKVTIGNQSELKLTPGLQYTGPEGARKMLEMMHNPTDGSELGLLTTENLDWFVLFEFEDSGYVKDADKEKLDAKAMLSSIKEGNESSNKARKERGWPAIQITGWHTEPFYNKTTNNLEWCIAGESEGHKIVNYNTRILGRGGVMSANLLVDPEELDKTLASVKEILGGFSFLPGKKYSEWRSGDKIAKYGLTALIVGGAVGAAAKLGFLAKIAASLGKLWKAIIVGLIALGAGIKRFLFGDKKKGAPPSSGGTQPPPPSAG
ncbi:MAG TPA: DUF2167 domain-containing protein [Polyangia bacterium]